MSIEERASKRFPEQSYMDDYALNLQNAYIMGANDQKKIDIDNGKKFCKKWLDEIIQLYLPDLKDEPFYTQALEITYNKFIKEMKE